MDMVVDHVGVPHERVRAGRLDAHAGESAILAEPVGGHADRTRAKRILELARPDAPILDDFAMRQLNATPADNLYELTSERQERSLINTSHQPPATSHQPPATSHQVIMNGPGAGG
ncbi:hypothetical protein ACWGDT_40155 [Streptomyces avermitilis]